MAKPVPNLMVNFMPEAGRPSWGKTDENGHYEMVYDENTKGVKLGRSKVYVLSSQVTIDAGASKKSRAAAAARLGHLPRGYEGDPHEVRARRHDAALLRHQEGPRGDRPQARLSSAEPIRSWGRRAWPSVGVSGPRRSDGERRSARSPCGSSPGRARRAGLPRRMSGRMPPTDPPAAPPARPEVGPWFVDRARDFGLDVVTRCGARRSGRCSTRSGRASPCSTPTATATSTCSSPPGARSEEGSVSVRRGPLALPQRRPRPLGRRHGAVRPGLDRLGPGGRGGRLRRRRRPRPVRLPSTARTPSGRTGATGPSATSPPRPGWPTRNLGRLGHLGRRRRRRLARPVRDQLPRRRRRSAPRRIALARRASRGLPRAGDAAGPARPALAEPRRRHLRGRDRRRRPAPAPTARGWAPLFADLDCDGSLDLYVTNDTQANELFRGLGGGTVPRGGHGGRASPSTARGSAEGSMGIDVADVDGDGRLDLAYSNFRARGDAALPEPRRPDVSGYLPNGSASST